MHKSFVLLGFTAALFLSQGCGGEKKQVANVPPDLATSSTAARPTTIAFDAASGNNPSPPMSKAEDDDDQQGGSQSAGGPPPGSPGGPPRGYGQPSPQGRSSSSGGGPSGYDGYQQQGNSGGGPNQSFGMNMDERGGNSANGGNSPQGPGARNSNRGNSRQSKPQTFKDQAVAAFQSGNSKHAYTLLQAHALNVSDEEAAEVLKDYRWAAHRKRPQLGINIAVGVTLKNPLNSTDLSPIGSESRGANGGGGSEFGMSGRGGMSGGNTANASSKSRTLAETTGDFGVNLVAAFKGLHDTGVWSPAFKDVSLVTSRANSAPRGGFGGGFSGGIGGDLDVGGFQPGSSDNNGGYPAGFGQPANAQGGAGSNPDYGQQSGNPNSGYQVDSAGGQPGNAGSSPKGNNGMMSGSLKFLQGNAGLPKKGGFLGNDISTSTGPSSPGTAPPGSAPLGSTPTGPSFSKDVLPILRANCLNCHSESKRLGGYSLSEFDVMLRGGESGSRAIVPGNSSESYLIQEIVPVNGKASMPKKANALSNKDIDIIKRWIDAGAINDSQSSSPAGAGGPRSGGLESGTNNASSSIAPSFVANVTLPPGTSPLAPCLNYIGVDESAKLIKKAAQEGYDGLLIFEVTIGRNPALRKVTNDTFVRVFQPNSVTKDAKKFYGSKTFKNLMVERSRSRSEPDGLEEEVAKVVKETEEAFHLQSIPSALTPEIIANKRVPTLVKETETSVIDRLSEVNLYYSKGLLDESQKADAFEQIAGPPGKAIATGSPADRLAAIEKLLEREFK